jgi:DNA-directed RNA polymerase subunit RPC12/RpoP
MRKISIGVGIGDFTMKQPTEINTYICKECKMEFTQFTGDEGDYMQCDECFKKIMVNSNDIYL